MYAATYDHIGSNLWGVEKFQRVMEGELDWLERYPDVHIGLDHEAYTYDYLAVHALETPQKLREQGGLGETFQFNAWLDQTVRIDAAKRIDRPVDALNPGDS